MRMQSVLWAAFHLPKLRLIVGARSENVAIISKTNAPSRRVVEEVFAGVEGAATWPLVALGARGRV